MTERMFNQEPKAVPAVQTKFRRIATKIPVPESLPILRDLALYEPRSMGGQPPVIWDRAEGVNVFDPYGNIWLDFSSGVLVANAGHAHPQIVEAISREARKGFLHNYCFPSKIRARLAKRLAGLLPEPLKKVFLLTTGAEAVECVIKLARAYGAKKGGPNKRYFITFQNAFHGRTLGAQLAGGIADLKGWIGQGDFGFAQVPFPDGFRVADTGFDLFLRSLKDLSIAPDTVAAVMSETYQGGGACFMPVEYAKNLRRWCSENDALLIFDEVQAGFGRTGTMFGFEHYGVVPDLICLGKGITSSLPLSAVVGPPDVMDVFEVRKMTSTHSGNPVCAAAALASIDVIVSRRLHENAREMGALMHARLSELRRRWPSRVGAVHGKGLVAGVHVVRDGALEPDGNLAFDVVEACLRKGLLMFAPVGLAGATIKIAPPLVITPDAVEEGCAVLAEAFDEVVGRRDAR